MAFEYIQAVEVGDDEHEVKIKYDATPGDPGRVHGPAEDCYPPEAAETSVIDIMVKDGKFWVSADDTKHADIVKAAYEWAAKNEDTLVEHAFADNDDGYDYSDGPRF